MLKKSFNNISIRGRVAYCIMSFEAYVKQKYPNRDFSTVCRLMWNIVNETTYIDISAYHYMEIIPEYLYEFDSYEEADFEYITADEFTMYRNLLPKEDEQLNLIMHRIYDIAMEYAYEALPAPGKETIDYTFDVIMALTENSIPLPNLSKVSISSFDEYDGWGSFINYKGLSIYI